MHWVLYRIPFFSLSNNHQCNVYIYHLSANLEFLGLHGGFSPTCTWNPDWFAGKQNSAIQSPETFSWISPATHSANTPHPLIPTFQIERLRSAFHGVMKHRHLTPLNFSTIKFLFCLLSKYLWKRSSGNPLKGTLVTPLAMQTFITKPLEDNERWHWWAMLNPEITILWFNTWKS